MNQTSVEPQIRVPGLCLDEGFAHRTFDYLQVEERRLTVLENRGAGIPIELSDLAALEQ